VTQLQNYKKTEQMKDEVENIKSDCTVLKDKHTDLQARSMRDNLIFSGIPENKDEDTEEELRKFIAEDMQIEQDMAFHRVHRMGNQVQGKNRPIIAKFVLHKDRELVRKNAPKTLKNTNYGVNEQFPREINERRKLLYPHYKAAKRQGKKAVMNADKLYIEGSLFTPEHEDGRNTQLLQRERNDVTRRADGNTSTYQNRGHHHRREINGH